MRTVRRVVTLGLGAAAGATATWLLDPDQGRRRRREVARLAAQRARERADREEIARRAAGMAVAARVTAVDLAARAAAAYRDEQARRTSPLATGSDR